MSGKTKGVLEVFSKGPGAMIDIFFKGGMSPFGQYGLPFTLIAIGTVAAVMNTAVLIKENEELEADLDDCENSGVLSE